MPAEKTELKDECVRLRVEERKSLREIQGLTGASKGSLSAWLRPHPLSDTERRERAAKAKRYVPPKKDRGEESALSMMAKKHALTPSQRGQVAEAAVLLRLAVNGMYCFSAVFDGDKVDWLVRVPSTERTWKLQVKLAQKCTGSLPTVSLRSSQSKQRYKQEDVDFLVGYDLFTDTAYVWSWSELSHLKASVTISPSAAEKWDKLET